LPRLLRCQVTSQVHSEETASKQRIEFGHESKEAIRAFDCDEDEKIRHLPIEMKRAWAITALPN
jgi:hypothetical protein